MHMHMPCIQVAMPRGFCHIKIKWEITNINLKGLYTVFIDPTFFGIFVCGPLQSFVVIMFVLYDVFGGHRSITDLICCNFCMVLSMFLRLVLANPLYFLCNTSTWHLDSCPDRRRDIVHIILWVFGILGEGLNQTVWTFFNTAFSGCYVHTDELQ